MGGRPFKLPITEWGLVNEVDTLLVKKKEKESTRITEPLCLSRRTINLFVLDAGRRRTAHTLPIT